MAKAATMDDQKKPQQPQAQVPTPKLKKGFKHFWTEVVRELKKVNWPSRRETTRLTGVVLTMCVMITLILYGMSYVADTLLRILQKGF